MFADSTSPAIHIWDMHRKQEMLVKDYTSYPTEFPFKDPSCLVRPGYTADEILQMHQEDVAEEERIVAELAAPAVTRSQSAQLAATPVSVQPAPILVMPSPLAPVLHVDLFQLHLFRILSLPECHTSIVYWISP